MITTSSQEPTRNERVLVGNTSIVISERRPQQSPRKTIVVRNISPNETDIITVNLGYEQAVAENGILLKRNESFTDSSETGYLAFQGSITAICATANGVLAIYER
jgi:hypothetical protein